MGRVSSAKRHTSKPRLKRRESLRPTHKNTSKRIPKSNTRRIVAIVGDLHVGGTTALWPADGFQLEDGQTIHPNKIQSWLWDSWRGFWSEVKHRAHGSPIIGIVNGEYIDGNHHATTQLMTPSVGVQCDAAEQVCTWPRSLCAEWWSLRGTAAHAGQGGQDDDSVAKALGSVRDPETSRHSFYELTLDVGGVLIDIAHHISSTMRPWTKGNNIRTEILSVMMDALHDGRGARLPDLIVRSHVHQHIDTQDMYRIRGVVLPAWQYKTAYVARLTRARSFTVGGLIIEIESEGIWDASLWLRSLPAPATIKSRV